MTTQSFKQHDIVKRALNRIGQKNDLPENFYIEEHLLDNSYKPDFFIPQLNLCIEINGQRAFYPHTRKENQVFLMKNKLLLGNQFSSTALQ